jgi:hypothetical protein
VTKVFLREVHYKERVACPHLIFLPESERRVQCHSVKPEPNQSVTVDNPLVRMKIKCNILLLPDSLQLR